MHPDIDAKRDAFLALIAQRPTIMGILNVTPDSFSDGGRHNAPKSALAQAQAMIADGCDIVDIGGESTRPGADRVGETEELQRVLPVLELLLAETTTPVSIDTYKASVAHKAAELGAAIINDVTGLHGDPAMAETAAETGCALVAMHFRETTDDAVDIIDDMKAFFEKTLEIAQRAGIPEDRIILDPGVGFGKTVQQNLTCIHQLDALKTFGLPLLLGVSRKSFIGKLLDVPLEDRLTGTLVADLVGVMRGANIIRVHDVKEHRQMLMMAQALGITA